jgi:Ca2+/Na+ antiporter
MHSIQDYSVFYYSAVRLVIFEDRHITLAWSYHFNKKPRSMEACPKQEDELSCICLLVVSSQDRVVLHMCVMSCICMLVVLYMCVSGIKTGLSGLVYVCYALYMYVSGLVYV